MKTLPASLLFKPFIILLISCHLFGCYTWKEVNKPIEVIMLEKPKLVKVQITDHSELELHNAFIQNDSLIGTQNTQSIGDSTSIALDDITKIKMKYTNSDIVLLIILVPTTIAALAGLAFLFIAVSEMGYEGF